MPIACVYCGGAHRAPDEVRACWQRSAGAAVESAFQFVEADPSVDAEQTTATPEVRADVPERSAAELAGPEPLGRGLLVAAGADVPPPWSSAPRIRVDAGVVTDPSGAVDQLRSCWLARQRFVVDVAVDGFEHLAQPVETAPLHQLGPRFAMLGEHLHHLATANSVDARGGSARWPLLERALTIGATPQQTGQPGDVVGPDGIARWLDGGALTFLEPLDGVDVVHRLSIDHRSLAPFASNDPPPAELAPDQLAAVTHPGGAARIIAPAGSGKTRVLAERARHLVSNWRLPAGAVTLVAFNKRAQVELRERTADVPGLQVRTLNAIALAIVNGSAPFARQPRQRRTINEVDVRRLLGRLVKLPKRRNVDPMAVWVEALSRARLGLRHPASVEGDYDGDVQSFESVLPRYRRQLADDGTLDFDEQVQVAIELLLADPEVRAAARRACGVLLVDEFQDLAPAHLLLVRLLAGPDGAVFGVGDDDQTIYGYNGADPAWLIDFAELFPGAGMHPLEVNYRCPGGVVEVADRLLRHNRWRVPKVIRAAKPGSDGWTVIPTGGDSASHDDSATLAATVAEVTDVVAGGIAPADVAVLTRVNSMLAPVQIALRHNGIPVNGGVGEQFAEQTAVRSALAWLRLASGEWSPADITEALRRPSRSLHPRVATWVGEQRSIADLQRLAGRLTSERDAERVESFAADIATMRNLLASGATTAAFIEALRRSIGLENAVATLDGGRRGMNRSAQNDDLTALAQIASLQPDPAAFESWLRRWLREPSDGAGVVLATVHKVKGLEWSRVVVHHADADQFPHRLAEDVEEERRLFHVALTRAIDRVVVVTGQQPSPFVDELTAEAAPIGHGVERRADERRLRVVPSPRAAAPAAQAQSLDADGEAVFERLRTLRRELANGKPAYVVFDDKTLRAIAAASPATLGELAAIRGVGPAKLDQYGAAVLAAIGDLAAG